MTSLLIALLVSGASVAADHGVIAAFLRDPIKVYVNGASKPTPMSIKSMPVRPAIKGEDETGLLLIDGPDGKPWAIDPMDVKTEHSKPNCIALSPATRRENRKYAGSADHGLGEGGCVAGGN